MSRVAVVAIVLLFTFTAVSVPAYAVPQGGGKTAAKVESGWLDAAIAWFSQLVNGGTAVKSVTTSSSLGGATPLSGSCVDPFGCPGGIGGGGL